MAADTSAAGAGNNGLGVLSVQADAALYAATIALRGADMNIDPTATVGSPVSGGMVTTLAGSANAQWGSSDGTASAARFYDPNGVAVDSAGNVYVADTQNEDIRKISRSGIVTTLAGSAGQSGSSNGTGSAAMFDWPHSVAVDSAGNVYVADQFNQEIRKITPSGVVATLAGSAGQYGSSDGTGSAASFYTPEGVAVDSAGNVYVADAGKDVIRKITPSGVVSTLAGSAGQQGFSDGTGSTARFSTPVGVAVDSAGNVYVADQWNAIRKITPAGVVSTLAGSASDQWGYSDGTGSAARFNYPAGVAVDSAGNVYVADEQTDLIRKITPSGVVTTLAGGSPGVSGSNNGVGSAASFCLPMGVAVDSAGNVYVADTYNDDVRQITPISATSQVTIRASLPSLPMSLGGGPDDVDGINLTDAELACIQTAAGGTVTIGDSTETGDITFRTARVATTAGAGTVVVQATGGPGQIIFDDQGSGPDLDGNGGTVQLTPGSGGIQVIQSSTSPTDIAIASNGFSCPAAPLTLTLNVGPRTARRSR